MIQFNLNTSMPAHCNVVLLHRPAVNLKYYRGFIPKGDRVLGHNIVVVPNLRYGLKRRSGTFASISDLNEGLVYS